MSTPNDNKRQQLISKLKELFQLDQPDLDFGLYRIMHAKSAEITQFLETDLLPQVQAAFALYKTADKAEIEKELAKVIAGIEAAGMDPNQSPKVKELQAKLQSEAVDVGGLEGEVYDHLLSFFRRYYSEGDYLSRRVYKPGVYAIPYEGEEVKLHWANADQYYIKSSERLRDYTFRLQPESVKKPLRVHFRLTDVAEGAHGNVKTDVSKSRVFVLASAGESGVEFVAEEDGAEGKELVIRFVYRPATLDDWTSDTRDGKNKPPAQKELVDFAVKRILGVKHPWIAGWVEELKKPHLLASGDRAEYTKIEAHLRRFAARNTFDYFIHKELGGFLRRELDFYIKNELMHLDDVENETAPRVEQYLSKIRVVRKVAGKVIDFLAQLEEFQKKLWTKKKFVVRSWWCISVGCVPEEFYGEILSNADQLAEWVDLFSVDRHLASTESAPAVDGNAFATLFKASGAPPPPLPSTPEFLKAHPTLTVNTDLFPHEFTDRLIGAIDGLDQKTDAILIHSDNFHALSMMQSRFRGKIGCIYVDPPYNTGADEFLYKDAYRHSSWLSLYTGRIDQAIGLLENDGVLSCSLDGNETFHMRTVMGQYSPRLASLGEFVWRTRNTDNRVTTRLSVDHDYIHVFTRQGGSIEGRVIDRSSFKNPDNDPRGPYTTDPLTGKANAQDRPNLHYVITNEDTGDKYPPQPDFGWITDEHGFEALRYDKRVYWPKNPKTGNPRKKRFLYEAAERAPVSSLEIQIKQGEGNRDLAALFGDKPMNFPKPVSVIKTVIDVCSAPDSIVLDFFAGSGTTGESVIQLNREGDCSRRVILIEAGEHFDSLLVPRVRKSTYSPDWDAGRPNRYATDAEAARSPRLIKLVRLESYEDVLNNLSVKRTEAQQSLLEATDSSGEGGLREDYLLRYMLEVETRGSVSLLNLRGFSDPTSYTLEVKAPGSDVNRIAPIDLLETFNWLIGISVVHVAAPSTFTAEFERGPEARLSLVGRLKSDSSGRWWFKTVTGTLPDGRKALVVWRKLTGKPEEDNLVLDEWFTRQGYSSKDSEFDLIYVNGGNNLENLKAPDDTWKVRLIEEDFHRLMFATEGL